jgi:cardiolipin synthase
MSAIDRIPLPLTLALVGLYLLILIFTVIRIMLDTHSSSKTLAYLLVVTVLPFVGIVLYFSVGMNLRKRLPGDKIRQVYRQVTEGFQTSVPDGSDELLERNKDLLRDYSPLISFISQVGTEPLSANQFKLLVNGEAKFPDVIEALATATHHIHMEYYAWENDIRGNQVKDVLLEKAAAGVKVRVMYDAYASRKIRKNIVREMKAGGIEVYPVIKVKLLGFANRVNHRDHRKIIIIDGRVGYLGGINMSDRYDNSIDTGLYWRDTHVRITGPLVLNIQRHFLINWNIFTPVHLHVDRELFPAPPPDGEEEMKGLAQVMAGGPVYRLSNIMFTYAKLISLSKEKLYITNPYFIPSDTIVDALKQAALSGVDVRLLLPYKSDSALVGAASRFYFNELLETGVRIFLYKKGFVHAKTMVADGKVSIVGSANMDIRSFDLNFEIMPVIYDRSFAGLLEATFMKDLEEAVEVDPSDWQKTPVYRQLNYAVARLISAFL